TQVRQNTYLSSSSSDTGKTEHIPVLLFPRHRKHLSVKFPEDTPITLPTLLRFILKHSDSAHQPMKADGSDPHPHILLKAEFRALQGEVQTLHRARQRLSNQLAQLWRDNRRLSFHAVALETHNALLQSQNGELQRERLSLVEQHKEKSRQLGEAVRRLQELADASENLLTENTLLRVLLGALRARETERGEEEETGEERGEEEETGEETGRRMRRQRRRGVIWPLDGGGEYPAEGFTGSPESQGDRGGGGDSGEGGGGDRGGGGDMGGGGDRGGGGVIWPLDEGACHAK
ncbi:thioredoxin domain-containing protein 11-like, partial [Oncorhynchus kisutch]|uniref:thioredoxin domain-containing protein 11-like n=1 Tax=Oncorhynchus kisutch TaxID=8019 RepID=UPI0012DDC035